MSINNIISAIILLILFSGCLNEDFQPDEWALEPELEFSKSTVVFNSSSSVDSVDIFTNYADYSAVSNNEWCRVSVDRDRSIVIIDAEPNFDTSQRSSEITITISRGNRTLSKNISVVQMGGIWETIGDFNVYWGYAVSESQEEAIKELLINMVYVDGGEFVMGNTNDLIVDSAHPHNVSLSSFHIGKYEITQKQWRAVMGMNPSIARGVDVPVYNISWAEALEFCTRLSKLIHLNVTLPTEAQWEFAAKGGNKSRGYIYSGSDDYHEVAQYNNETEGVQQPTNIGLLQCNEMGLYDMSGNVAEYCSDWFELDFEDSNPVNPQGPLAGSFKCIRGGHANTPHPYYLRITNRLYWSNSINKITPYTGLRIVVNESAVK